MKKIGNEKLEMGNGDAHPLRPLRGFCSSDFESPIAHFAFSL